MALKLTESFDGQATVSELTAAQVSSANNGNKWTATDTTAVLTDARWEFAAGRTGNGLRVKAAASSQLKTFNLGLGVECFVGFAYKPVDVVSSNDLCYVLAQNGQQLLALAQVNGTLVVRDFNDAAVLTTAAVLSAGTWVYIEVRFKMADAGGVITVHVNGISAGTYTGDTKAGGTTSIDALYLGDPTGGQNQVGQMFDDLYILDSVDSGVAGMPNNNFLGPSKVHCIRPNGNGNSSQWVGSDGNSTDNYQLVDEQSVNDADYVEATSDGEKDTYAFEDVPALSGDVAGVCVMARGALLNAGDPKSIVAVSRLSAAEDDSADLVLTTTLRRRVGIFEATPAAAAWTEADVNAAEWGYKQTDA